MKRSLTLLFGAALLAVAGVGAYGLGAWLRPAPALAGTPLERPPSLDDVRFLRAGGSAGAPRATTLAEAGGELTLLFFGYTRCPDVCPLTLSRLARMYRDWGEPDGVRVVMITLDPEHDTPELVQRYAAGFHPDFVGLTGDDAAIATAARRFYIGANELPDGTLAHTDAVAVVDRRGRMRYVYSQTNLAALGDDLPRLRRLL